MEKNKAKNGARLSEGKGKPRMACVKVYDLTWASVSQLEELNREKEMWVDLTGKLYLTFMESEKEHLREMLEVRTQLVNAYKMMNETLKDLARRYKPKEFEAWEAENKANQVEPNLTILNQIKPS